jgi:hypothetical protein
VSRGDGPDPGSGTGSDPGTDTGADHLDVHPGGTARDPERVHDRPGVTVARDLSAPPEQVMSVLLRAPTFPVWVVGPGRVIDVDPTWPGVGSGFTHETGRGPIAVRDRTIVQFLDRDNGRLTLTAHVWPAGEAAIQLHVVPRGSGSRVVMHERPIAGPGSWLPQLLYRPALRARNVVSLRRLERLVALAEELRGDD